MVSLSPSLTETIYLLGAEEKLIGVTRFCEYPPEAKTKERVGGFLDPNYEAIYRLRPDVVLIPGGAVELRKTLENYHLRVVECPQKTVDDVLASTRLLGEILGCSERAEELVQETLRRLEKIRQAGVGRPRPRVLFVVGRNYSAELPEEVYLVGKDGLCDAVLELAGGENAYTGEIAFPKVSVEGILRMNPDVILEITPDAGVMALSDEAFLAPWKRLPQLDAVRNDRVFRLCGNPPLLPSPSLLQWVEKTAELLRDSER